MHKIYLSRAQSRVLAMDQPIGDPYGGPAYGEKNDPVSAMIGVAALSAGSSMLASGEQADAASDAADASASASKYSADIQKEMYDQTREDQTPWLETGQSALEQLAQYMGIGESNGQDGYGSLTKDFSMDDYEADPGYAFRLSEGEKALERSASSRGGLYSGRYLKDLTRFSQDTASQEYGNAYNRYQSNQTNQYNRLASLAGVGQTANNALSDAGSSYANSVGNLTMTDAANQGNLSLAAGNANASGYSGVANALGKINWGSLGGSSTSSGWNDDTMSYGSGGNWAGNSTGFDW